MKPRTELEKDFVNKNYGNQNIIILTVLLDIRDLLINQGGTFKMVEEKEEKWPKGGDNYWRIDAVGGLNYRTCNNEPVDHFSKLRGEVFRTEAEAKEYLKKLTNT